MRARCTRQAHSVRDRAIASNSINSVVWIGSSVTRRGAAIMPCRHLCGPVRLQYMAPHWRPATTGWFHGIDVLGVNMGPIIIGRGYYAAPRFSEGSTRADGAGFGPRPGPAAALHSERGPFDDRSDLDHRLGRGNPR